MEFYSQFDGDRGALLDELNDPSNDEFSDLVDKRDISVDGGETTRRFFTVEPVPGRGVVAFDFFIPSENSNGFAGDDRPEEGTDILRDDLPLTDSRVMIVIDFETGRGVIVQAETHLDLPAASTGPTSRARSRSTAIAAPGTTWAGSTSTRRTRSTCRRTPTACTSIGTS